MRWQDQIGTLTLDSESDDSEVEFKQQQQQRRGGSSHGSSSGSGHSKQKKTKQSSKKAQAMVTHSPLPSNKARNTPTPSANNTKYQQLQNEDSEDDLNPFHSKV